MILVGAVCLILGLILGLGLLTVIGIVLLVIGGIAALMGPTPGGRRYW